MLLPTTEALPDRTPVDSVSGEQAAALMLDGHMAALSIITPALPHITKASQRHCQRKLFEIGRATL